MILNYLYIFFLHTSLLVNVPQEAGIYNDMQKPISKVLVDLENAFHTAIEKALPAIVHIRAHEISNPESRNSSMNIGSGIIISDDTILTNKHVIENADSVTIIFSNNNERTYTNSDITISQKLDLAKININHNCHIKPAKLGNSDDIQVGDWAIVLGSPYGFVASSSFGIISKTGRNLIIENAEYTSMIQTDAAINLGNSGGALINLRGEVVGIATAIYAPKEVYSGIGFAIPIKQAITELNLIIKANDSTHLAAKKNETINLTENPPKDTTHNTFSDCTKCHHISAKITITKKSKLNHELIIPCDKCHIFGIPKSRSAIIQVTQRNINNNIVNYNIINIVKILPMIIVASLVFNMMGVGGGLLYVPLLLTAHLDFHTASSTSLLMITVAHFSALYVFVQNELVDYKLALMLEPTTCIGAFVGAYYASAIPGQYLYKLFSLVLIIAVFLMTRERSDPLFSSVLSKAPNYWTHDFQNYTFSIDMRYAWILTFGIGFIGGILGIAGGWLKVPMMYALFNIPMKIAIGTSSLMVCFTTLIGFIGHSFAGHVDFRIVTLAALASIAGAQIGSRFTIKIQKNLIIFIFSCILIFISLWMMIKSFYI